MAVVPKDIQTIRHWVDFAWPVTNARDALPGMIFSVVTFWCLGDDLCK